MDFVTIFEVTRKVLKLGMLNFYLKKVPSLFVSPTAGRKALAHESHPPPPPPPLRPVLNTECLFFMDPNPTTLDGDRERGGGGGVGDVHTPLSRLFFMLEEKPQKFLHMRRVSMPMSADSEQLQKLLQNPHLCLTCRDPLNYRANFNWHLFCLICTDAFSYLHQALVPGMRCARFRAAEVS